MDIDQLSAWGEFIGGIAVLAGLVFVGVQLLVSNRETRARTMQATLELQTSVDAQLAAYPETWDKVITNGYLEGVEKRRAIIMFNVIMTNLENRYHQYRAGYLEPAAWEATVETLKKTLECNISVDWRASIGAMTHAAEFLELVDELQPAIQQEAKRDL